LALVPVALVVLGALGLAALVRAYGKPDLLRELPEHYAIVVAEFVVTQVFVLLLMVSFSAGYMTYVWLTVELDLPEEVAALAAIGVGALSWFAQLLLARCILNLMPGG